MMKWGWLIFVLLLLWTNTSLCQSLTHLEFPTEDELLEALEQQEISYNQYLQLRELAGQRLDSTNLHLLDQIPNLSFFRRFDSSAVSSEETEQATPFMSDRERSVVRTKRIGGSIEYRYLQELEEEGAAWYRTQADFRFDEFRLAARIQRERSGRERLASRRLSYLPTNSAIKEISLGNLSRRLGLGTAFGYRGKVLDIPEGLSGDAVLHPDYNGINGVYSRIVTTNWEVQALASSQRGEHYRLATGAASVGRKLGKHQSTVILAGDRITKRSTSSNFDLGKFALNHRYSYKRGYVETEMGGVTGGNLRAHAAVLEGRHKLSAIRLRYAAWSYGREFVDLSAGSKAGEMRQSTTLDGIGLELSSRRTGQDGVMLRSLAEITDKAQLRSSVLYYDNDVNSPETQLSTGIDYAFSDQLSIDLSYLGGSEDARQLADNPGLPENLYKLELRFRTGRLRLRSYIAYNDNDDQRDNWSWLAVSTVKFLNGSRLKLWTRVKGMKQNDRRYRYIFVESIQPLTETLTFEAKLSYSYSSERTDKSSTWITLGLGAQL